MDIGWLYQMDPVELIVLPVEAANLKSPNTAFRAPAAKSFGTWWRYSSRKSFTALSFFATPSMPHPAFADSWWTGDSRRSACMEIWAQSDRNRIMAAYKAGKIAILIATDVAARGIDVTDVDAVIHYETPLDNETYTHRSGRTGRAGKEGEAYLFYAPDDKKRLDNIIRYTKSVMIPLEITDEGEIREKSDK